MTTESETQEDPKSSFRDLENRVMGTNNREPESTQDDAPPAQEGGEQETTSADASNTGENLNTDSESQSGEDQTEEPEAQSASEEGEEEESEDAGEEEEDGKSQRKKRGKSAKERVQQAVTRQREAEREAEYWKAVAEGRVQPPQQQQPAQEGQTQQTQEGQAQEGQTGEELKEPTPPNPNDYDYGRSDENYIEARIQYEADRRFYDFQKKQEEREEQNRRQQEAAEKQRQWQERAKKAAEEKYPDFAEKVDQGAQRGDWPCPPEMALAIMESEQGPDIAYHLASNPDEAKEIADMPTNAQYRAIGRLEARFAENSAPSQTSDQEATSAENGAKKKVASDAPEPPKRRTRGASSKHTPSDDTPDFRTFEQQHSPEKRRQA